jgi:hypothetical protein
VKTAKTAEAQHSASILERVRRSAWFRSIIIAISVGLVTHFAVPHIEEMFASPSVEITSPIAGEAVEWTPAGHLVTGTCRKVEGELHLYVLLHPLPTDTWYVQRLPTVIDRRHWQAIVFFGTQQVGIGHEYELCAVITSKILQEGQTLRLRDFPAYTVKAVITVTRLDAEHEN